MIVFFPTQTGDFHQCFNNYKLSTESNVQVHGMDMRNLGETSRREPVMEGLLEETVVTTPSLLLELDMHTCELVDLQISSIFHLKVKRQDTQ